MEEALGLMAIERDIGRVQVEPIPGSARYYNSVLIVGDPGPYRIP